VAEGAKHVMLEANGMALNAVDMGVQDMPAIVLLAGWPQTLRAWRFVQPTLRREGNRVIAIDPPGIGGSDLLPEGEMADTAGVADRIVAALRKTSVERFTLVGHDVGAWISYALASRHPKMVERVCLTEATIPGIAPASAFGIENAPRVFQFFFAATPDLPELLTQGREDVFFRYLFETKTRVRDAITEADLAAYVDAYRRPKRMSAGFAYYRAVPETARQNAAAPPLAMPVLAIGGEGSLKDAMERALAAKGTLDLRGQVFDGVGHYLPEEAPETFARAILDFIATTPISGYPGKGRDPTP
jgi:pimeloyl-ACP methyl ester carboxylesterase